ncbi:unnamed protein product [Acanthoscelides obtectus]|uniref:Uncharacterized protein n=1 Tax=Acanthoscelides obtectus TaxID=200917 RepID=A0A9P0PIX7_ACAOB|nr:unnamed protein product [Acanthoscelides obtectus]CAK1653100.1 hypothetical protein AOBTE_LOCUS18061 [Acanthoscelides obtectus]
MKKDFLLDILDGGLARAVRVAAEGGVLEESASSDGLQHLVLGGEVVVNAVHLSRTRLPGGVADAEAERIRVFAHHPLEQRALAGARWPAEDYGAERFQCHLR